VGESQYLFNDSPYVSAYVGKEMNEKREYPSLWEEMMKDCNDPDKCNCCCECLTAKGEGCCCVDAKDWDRLSTCEKVCCLMLCCGCHFQFNKISGSGSSYSYGSGYGTTRHYSWRYNCHGDLTFQKGWK